MRTAHYKLAVTLLSASALALSSPRSLRGIANKNTRARGQREQDADARVHKTPAQVEGALRATVARGEHDDTAANFAEAHARAGGAAARALEAPANAAQVGNLSKLGALAAGRRQLSTSLIEHPVGLYSTQTEAASSPNKFNFVTESDCFIKACCAAGWSGYKTCEATSPKGKTHKNDLTVITGTDGGKVLRAKQTGTDEAVLGQLPVQLSGNELGLEFKWSGKRGSRYYHHSVWPSSALGYDEDGQRITDDDRVDLPHVQFKDDSWHSTNGRYCAQSRVAGLVIRAPGVPEVDKEMVCDTNNHLDAIEFGPWFEIQQFWTWLSNNVSMVYTARSRKVGESEWNERSITFPTEYPRVNIKAVMSSLWNWWTGHDAELADIILIESDGNEKTTTFPDPTAAPKAAPTAAPKAVPTAVPKAVPTAAPKAVPTAAPKAVPTAAPKAVPTPKPSPSPTPAPTPKPSTAPTRVPAPRPTSGPSLVPTYRPSPEPTYGPSPRPSYRPSPAPAPKPTDGPTTHKPSMAPSPDPTSSLSTAAPSTDGAMGDAMTEDPQTNGNFINESLSLISLLMSGMILIVCCWGWRCKRRKKKEADEIVIQDATVVEEAGSRKASAPPAPPALAAAPESRTYSGTYRITMAESA